AATTCARCGAAASVGARSPSSEGSATSTRAPLSASIADHAAPPSRVFSGTATAPMRSAPKNVATHASPSGSSSATRWPGSTPSARSAWPVRQTSTRSSEYVVSPAGVTTAGQSPLPAATSSARKEGVAFAMAVWTVKIPSAIPSPRRPVEVLPELELDAIDDPRKLLAVVVAGAPQLLHGAELCDVREAVFGRLRHRHLLRQEAPIACAGMDPEALGGLLRVQARRLP